MSRLTPNEIRSRKNQTPLVVLTAYTTPIARLLDPHVDVLLVGDSLGMVVYGMETTRGVTLDMMIAHGRAVVGASSQALVVVDMPYRSVDSVSEALENSRKVLDATGADAIKIEGGRDMAEIITALTDDGIAVMGHVGLLPQRVEDASGYRYKGRSDEEAAAILEDALAVEKAGAFAIVIEAVREDIARNITKKLSVPTIGIGASPACDGQVLVIDDMLGISARAPRFVKRYAEIGKSIEEAAKAYAADVRTRTFPEPEHGFGTKKK